MKKLLILLCFFATSLSAQTDFANSIQHLTSADWASIMRGRQYLPTRTKTDFELRGHPFLFDTWDVGASQLRDSSVMTVDAGFKLNVEDHEIWTKGKENREYVLTDERIVALQLTRADGKHVFKRIQSPLDKSLFWGEIKFDGARYVLIKQVKKKFLEANYIDKGIAVSGRNYESFDTSEFWFILTKNKSKMLPIKLKRRDFTRIAGLTDDADLKAFRDFCSTKDIGSDLEEDDAVEVLEYLDKLK